MEKLPGKIKLGGADCFHLALDKHARNHSAGDNVVRIALHLDGLLSKKKLEERLNSIPVIHWLCNIRLVTPGFFRVPYWKYEDVGNRIDLYEHTSNDECKIPEAILNRDIGLDAKGFIEADLIHCTQRKTIVVLSWNHILMDGRGSGMLTEYINNPDPGVPIQAFFPEENKREGWIAHIRNMYKVKNFIETSSRPPVLSVASRRQKQNNDFKFKVISFDQAQTKKMEDNARRSGARFGITPFLIAGCAIAVNKVIKGRGESGNLWVPVPYDGRKRGAFGPVVSNNVSSLFYTFPQEMLETTDDAIAHISAQMTDQLKAGMPKKYSMLQDMMRHIPLGLYYKLVNRPGEGALTSFLFTATGDGIGNMKMFMDLPINDVVVYGPRTYPPGLTFLFLGFNDTFKLNISYAASVLNEDELALLENELNTVFFRN